MQIKLSYRCFRICYDGFYRIGKDKRYSAYFIGNVCSISRLSNISYDEYYAVMSKSQYRHGVVEVMTGDGSIFQFPVKVNGKFNLQIVEVDRQCIYDLLDNEENMISYKIVEG